MSATKVRRKQKKGARALPRLAPASVPVFEKAVVQPTESAEPSALRWKYRIAPAVLLALLTFVVYIRVIHYPFSNYDDGEYVIDNGNIHRGITWPTIRWALTSTEHANWHPVTWLSHALDWQLFGPDPAGHHLTSLLLHVVNVVLLFFFLAKVTKSTAPSFGVAALFALHPVVVESVVWVAERKNVLCATFFLIALLAFARYAQRPNVGRYLLVAMFFAFSLAAKPMVVTFPLVLLLLDYSPLQRVKGWSQSSAFFPAPQFPAWKLALEKLPLVALSAADCVLTVVAQQKVNAIRAGTAYPLSLRLQNAIFSYADYLWKALWPLRLAILYPYPAGGIPALRMMIAVLSLSILSFWVWRERARRPYLIVGWLWFLGMLVPVIGLIQVGEQGMADRYAYLPLMGIFITVVWAGFDLLKNAERRVRLVAGAAAVVGLVALAGLSWRQVGFWRTNYDLWAHAAAVTENNASAEDVAGSELLLRAINSGIHYSSEAQVYFQRALQINPRDSEALMNIGADLQVHGRVAEALEKYKLALQYVDEDDMKTRIITDMGSAYEQLGEYTTAREYYRQGLQMSPSTDNASFVGYARTFTDEKIAALSATVVEHPTAQGYWQMGQLQDEGGYTASALASYRHALELDPKLEEARTALARDSKNKPAQN